ncbi:NUDIX hydrolase [Cellulomonas chitinilytica]|nr:NUDIX domain-containing protein [Cellulomonas chitinilytica]
MDVPGAADDAVASAAPGVSAPDPDPAPVDGAVDGPGHSLGPEWVPGEDGLLFRRAARVILLDESDRVLLIRGHDVDQPERSWWFTIGGGIDDGEDALSAAVREVHEETGIVLDPADVHGPAFTRSAIFDFYAQHCRQDEEIFVARVPSTAFAGVDRARWTAVEHDVIDELRWWSLDDLARVRIEVFPERLAELVASLLPRWDGTTRHLGLARE